MNLFKKKGGMTYFFLVIMAKYGIFVDNIWGVIGGNSGLVKNEIFLTLKNLGKWLGIDNPQK